MTSRLTQPLLGLITIASLTLLMTACSGKSQSARSVSPYGTGETKDGGLGLGTLRRVHFGFDQANLQQSEYDTLNYNIEKMNRDKQVRVLVEGHTDERGSSEYNIALGERRAKAVIDYVSNSGIARSRLQIKSWGEERPLDPSSSSEAYRYNRRAEFIITAR
ncbi:MAG: peptidoglycan-associated lipoprotein [Deltaproteobacteria bacterium CG11_big_fil_rev_8_21_14_0_20_45_16]|nr:MAG: peptidoglycan-associated lipoprotein [Deltaproteobacteria bacterium CG11_big_fil_rev_8_21_14_0_20_45_16]